MGDGRFIFRGGSRTNQALTPRPNKDTTAPEGQIPGLSVEETLEAALGDGHKKAQMLEVSRLKLPLAYCPDNPANGGRPGHGVIVPVDESGNVDRAALEQWASQRASQG